MKRDEGGTISMAAHRTIVGKLQSERDELRRSRNFWRGLWLLAMAFLVLGVLIGGAQP